MHTCLTLTNIGGHWFVEREVSGLIAKLRSYCDSIHSSDINIEGPSGEGVARCWRIQLKLRVLDEIVRVAMHAPERGDPQQSLSQLLATVYERARVQLDHISDHHHSCCSRGGHDTAERLEACA
jgi:hypothetical protein